MGLGGWLAGKGREFFCGASDSQCRASIPAKNSRMLSNRKLQISRLKVAQKLSKSCLNFVQKLSQFCPKVVSNCPTVQWWLVRAVMVLLVATMKRIGGDDDNGWWRWSGVMQFHNTATTAASHNFKLYAHPPSPSIFSHFEIKWSHLTSTKPKYWKKSDVTKTPKEPTNALRATWF